MWPDIDPRHALKSRRYLRYEALITAPITEIISA
jgi:hypothetical protein